MREKTLPLMFGDTELYVNFQFDDYDVVTVTPISVDGAEPNDATRRHWSEILTREILELTDIGLLITSKLRDKWCSSSVPMSIN